MFGKPFVFSINNLKGNQCLVRNTRNLNQKIPSRGWSFVFAARLLVLVQLNVVGSGGEGNETKFGEPVEYPRAMPDQYTAKSVKEDLDWELPTEVGTPPHQTWYKIWAAELKVGKSDNWSCDQRTKDLYVLSQYVMAELKGLDCPDEDRRFVQNFFNRKARAEDDLYALAAVAINSFLNNTIERYRGR
jgi:hypothetical protein